MTRDLLQKPNFSSEKELECKNSSIMRLHVCRSMTLFKIQSSPVFHATTVTVLTFSWQLVRVLIPFSDSVSSHSKEFTKISYATTACWKPLRNSSPVRWFEWNWKLFKPLPLCVIRILTHRKISWKVLSAFVCVRCVSGSFMWWAKPGGTVSVCTVLQCLHSWRYKEKSPTKLLLQIWKVC